MESKNFTPFWTPRKLMLLRDLYEFSFVSDFDNTKLLRKHWNVKKNMNVSPLRIIYDFKRPA